MKSLKIKQVLTICLLAATATLMSCSKDNDPAPQQQNPPPPPPPPPVVKTIEGTWIGKYGSGNNEPNKFFGCNIKPNGAFEIINKDNVVTANGTWTLEDNNFKATYTYNEGIAIPFFLSAKYDEDAEKISGDWGEDENVGSGTFYFDKQ